MNQSDKERWTAAVTMLAECLNRAVTGHILKGYWMALRDLSIDELEMACSRALQTSKFMPSPSELRELSGQATDADRAVMAWNDVLKALPKGPYKHIDFDDGLINATVRNLGGWPQFVSLFSSADEEKWTRQRFLKTYESFARTGVNGDVARPLPGLSEVSVVNGEVIEPIVHTIECTTTYRPRIESKTTRPKLEVSV